MLIVEDRMEDKKDLVGKVNFLLHVFTLNLWNLLKDFKFSKDLKVFLAIFCEDWKSSKIVIQNLVSIQLKYTA